MQSQPANSPHARYQTDGFYIQTEPILPEDVVQKASAGMDAIRLGQYDTGQPPCQSPWNPGDDPKSLCKIENNHKVGWIQLLYKPPRDLGVVAATNVGIHQDWTYWRNSWAGREPPQTSSRFSYVGDFRSERLF